MCTPMNLAAHVQYEGGANFMASAASEQFTDRLAKVSEMDRAVGRRVERFRTIEAKFLVNLHCIIFRRVGL